LEVLQLSAETGEGMPAWYAWLTSRAEKRSAFRHGA
jgi:hypothetical protein